MYFICTAEKKCTTYMTSMKLERLSLPFKVNREHIFDEVMTLYKQQSTELLRTYPFRVTFIQERAVDIGGVARDMFSAFYEVMYEKLFDGCSLLSPVVYPGMDVSALKIIGFIISHAYLTTGVLPVRIAFPCLSQCLLGSIAVSDQIMFDSFIMSISLHYANVVSRAIAEIRSGANVFSPQLMNEVLPLLSRFSVRELPTPVRFKEMLINIAKYEFIAKPSAALSIIHSGIPPKHMPFWETCDLPYLLSVYKAQGVSLAKVMKMFEHAEGMNSTEERIIDYLRQLIGNMTPNDLSTFLRFVTGSGTCSSKQINVIFNNSTGFDRRPIAHTCSPLELSTSYTSYIEFASEFKACLSNESSWIMDAI